MKLALAAVLGLFVVAYLVPDILMHRLGLWTITGARPSMGSISACALTFDDGPDPAFTPLILDVLKRHGCRATFFVVGEKAALLPRVMERMAREGHEIGLHGWDHRHPWLLDPITCRRNLRRAAAAVAPYVRPGISLKYRTPWGFWSLWAVLGSTGHQRVMWSLPGDDWKPKATPESVSALVRSRIAGGAIVLLHDGARYSWKTASALGAILQNMKEKGLRQVTVAELEEEQVAT